MIVFPNAKINLGLYVTEKRKDGYHNLQSCMVPVAWQDALEIIPTSSKLTFTSTGLAIDGKESENLCVKAFKLLNKDFQLLPVHIHLHKSIPMGAGLGGGSSDAAFTLKALNHHFELYLDDEILEEYAANLGSDCAFFIKNVPALAESRGEVLKPIELNIKGLNLVLINPKLHISTKDAFSGIHPKAPEIDLEKVLHQSPETWKEQLKNDFEATIFPKFPQIAQIKESLYEQGAVYASMTGSGASVYGLFKEKPKIKGFEQYLVWQGML